MTERFTRRDFGHLDLEITIDDPGAYLKPWTARVPANLLADSDLIETFCDNERDLGQDVQDAGYTTTVRDTQWLPSLIHFLAAARHRLLRIRTHCSPK